MVVCLSWELSVLINWKCGSVFVLKVSILMVDTCIWWKKDMNNVIKSNEMTPIYHSYLGDTREKDRKN